MKTYIFTACKEYNQMKVQSVFLQKHFTYTMYKLPQLSIRNITTVWKMLKKKEKKDTYLSGITYQCDKMYNAEIGNVNLSKNTPHTIKSDWKMSIVRGLKPF